MFSRPAFLTRFLDRLPDPRSVRFRVLGGVGLLAVSFGALLVFAAGQLDNRRCAEVAREHATTLAQTAGLWLDGDAHAGLGDKPEAHLADLEAVLTKLLEASDYDGVVRTLRPRKENKAALAAQPGRAHPKALEVVLEVGAGAGRKTQDVDYLPAMEEALFDDGCVSLVADGRVSAYAPIPDSWGSSPALVWVSGPAVAPLWRRLLFWSGAALFAGLLVAFALYLARRAADGLERQLAALEAGVRALAEGRSGGFALPRGAPRELRDLADSLESLGARLEAQANGQPLPGGAASEEPAASALGEPSEFDLALLVQQLVEPARKQARQRGIDLQLVFPEVMPSQLVGHPLALFRALECLLRNALRTTSQGRISVRVSRVGGGPENDRLRFEVTDTSPGIGFKEQQELAASLARAAEADPEALHDPLQIASAVSHALGSELSFESQPGQGSRFGFTARIQGLGPPPATGFHPRAQTGFHPQASTGFRPASAQTAPGGHYPAPLPAEPPAELAFVPGARPRAR